MPERIVVINDASRARGGATGLALLSVRLFRARGLPVTYVCGDAGDAPDLRESGVEVVAAGGARLLGQRALSAAVRGIRNPDGAAAVARVVARDRPGTVYHVHGWAQILSPAIFEALAPVASRTVVHAHDMFLACPNGVYMDYRRDAVCDRVPLSAGCLATNCDKRSYPQKLWRVARQAALRRAFGRGDWAAVVPIHPAMAERLSRGGHDPRKMRVVRNPARAWTQARIAAEDNAGLLYVGRLEPDKGVRDLVAAARRTGLPLALVGDGSLRAELDGAPGVEIAGWQDRPGIGRIAARARALVMPSRHPEPFALVLPEAVLSGLPVVTSDTALMAGEIAEGGFGLSVDVSDRAAFDGALLRMAGMPAARIAAMSRHGAERGRSLASTEEGWADALLALYGDALTGRLAARLSA